MNFAKSDKKLTGAMLILSKPVSPQNEIRTVPNLIMVGSSQKYHPTLSGKLPKFIYKTKSSIKMNGVGKINRFVSSSGKTFKPF